MDDPFNLQRFVDAQDPIYASVRSELREGRKHGHWMWFIFPQLHGLGSSAMAQRYAIRSLDEARAYLQDGVLGPRLLECTQLVMDVGDPSLEQILGYPDNLKFRSCMTLFAHADPENPVFTSAVQRYCGGEDAQTLERL